MAALAATSKNPGGNLHEYQEAVKRGIREPYGKGKNLPDDHRVKISESLKAYHGKMGEALFPPERRAYLSRKRSDFLRENPSAQCNARVAGNRSKMTYPEKVAHDWFQRNQIQAIHNSKVDRFFPDFLVGNVIVEIDGERWHSSPEQQDRDRKRDAVLTSLGYKIHRIPAKDRIELRLAEIFLKGQQNP